MLLVCLTDSPVEEVGVIVASLGHAVPRLPEWTDYRAALVNLEQAGVRHPPKTSRAEAPSGSPRASAAPGVLAAAPRARIRRASFATRLSLRSHETLIAEFRDLDKRLIAVSTDRIIAICNAERPEPIASPGSEVGLLRHEAGKKRRHLPVRKLFERIPELLPALKPCRHDESAHGQPLPVRRPRI